MREYGLEGKTIKFAEWRADGSLRLQTTHDLVFIIKDGEVEKVDYIPHPVVRGKS